MTLTRACQRGNRSGPDEERSSSPLTRGSAAHEEVGVLATHDVAGTRAAVAARLRAAGVARLATPRNVAPRRARVATAPTHVWRQISSTIAAASVHEEPLHARGDLEVEVVLVRLVVVGREDDVEEVLGDGVAQDRAQLERLVGGGVGRGAVAAGGIVDRAVEVVEDGEHGAVALGEARDVDRDGAGVARRDVI